MQVLFTAATKASLICHLRRRKMSYKNRCIMSLDTIKYSNWLPIFDLP
jgi:hypothetical protein